MTTQGLLLLGLLGDAVKNLLQLLLVVATLSHFYSLVQTWYSCFIPRADHHFLTHDGSMVLLYMVTWIPSIYPKCYHI